MTQLGGLFGGGMPFGMFGGGQGMLGGQTPDKVNTGMILSALLQDLGAQYDKRPANALPMLQYQQGRLGDQKKYQDTLAQLSAPPSTTLTPPKLAFPGGVPTPGSLQVEDPGSINAVPGGPLASPNMAQFLPLLQGMTPDKGLPLAFNAFQDEQQTAREDARYAQQRADQRRRPATPEEKVKYGLDPLTPAEIDGRGNITPISDPRAITPYQQKALENDAEGRKLQWAQFGETRRHNTASEASAGRGAAPSGYRLRADGKGLEFIPGGPADPVVAGRGTGKPTEDQAKNAQLYDLTKKQLPVAEKYFDDLASPANLIPRAGAGALNAITFGAVGDPQTVTGEKGRLAENAIRDIVTNFTYSVSGAQAPPKEIDDKMQLVTPKLTDSSAVKAEKRARLRWMVDSIKFRATPGAAMQAAGSAPAPTQAAGGWSNFRVSQ